VAIENLRDLAVELASNKADVLRETLSELG
jgi:hypothetical protein